jgi:uncharacterized protein (TIGR04141 family)
MYTHGQKVIYPDINLQGFLKTVDDEEQLSADLLDSRRVSCANADHEKVFKSWSVYRCLYAEIDLDERKYILNGGKWFSVDVDFVERTDKAFSKIAVSKINLPAYAGGGEGAYNAAVAAADPDRYVLLDDKNKIMHGGGHGQVEVCDLLSIDRELIHVKHYAKSSVLSHLFAQGFVSGQLIQIDGDFRKKIRQKLKSPFKAFFDADAKPSPDDFTIVFGVISEAKGPKLHLPFFSSVNLNNTAKILSGYGYEVQLLKIDVDDDYAKTAKIPPKKH